MQHADIENDTPFAFAQLYSYDATGRPVAVAIVQAVFDIVTDSSSAPTTHRLERAAEQPEVNFCGEPWEPSDDEHSPDPPPGEEGVVSHRIEPCTAYVKLATDVVLVGHARAPSTDTTRMRVGLKVGPLEKVLVVHGDRRWVKEGNALVPSEARRFERIPLRYERAFGGWDRSHDDPDEHHAYAPNPLGIGYRKDDAPQEEGLALPNVEDPEDPLEHYGQVVSPAGFGFVAPGWEPRSKLAGTYDEQWIEHRMPYLAEDFDPRFFNAASPGLVADGHLAGAEPVAIFGTTADHMLFGLPGIGPFESTVERVNADDIKSNMPLDTVIIDTDRSRVTLWYRSHAVLRDGPRDVRAIRIARRAS
jgi:hypothetical protein